MPSWCTICRPAGARARLARRFVARRFVARRLVAVLALGMAGLAGCSRAPSADSQPGRSEGPSAPPAASPAATPVRDAAAIPAEREVWEVCFLQGARVGHTRTAIRRVAREGRTLVQVDSLTRLSLKRSATPIQVDGRQSTLETPEGRLIEFSTSTSGGPVSMTTTGRVQRDRLLRQTTTTGRTETTSIPWSDRYGGLFALPLGLARRPMQPGERRTLEALQAGDLQVAVTELVARDYEPVKLLAETKRLLRIDTTTTVAGQPLRETLWTDSAGEIWKTFSELLSLEAFRTTKEEALRETAAAELDVFWSLSVPVSRRLDNPHATKRIRYRVELAGGEAAALFPAGGTQQVRALDAGAAEVTVRAVRPGGPAGDPQPRPDAPTDADRRPNNWIQSDYPKIAAAAEQAAAGRTDPWPLALALEQATRRLISKPGYRQALDTAADAIESGSGDCTEHAVLLAALARARGIPARVAIGLVYVAADQKFLYHMWDEVHVDGRWIPLDATLAQGGIGAAHLKLAHASFEGPSPYASILPVAQVAGKLKIEILEVE